MRLLFIALALMPMMGVSDVAAQRTPWTTSRVKGSPDPPRPYQVERVYAALQFRQPVELMVMPGSDRMMLLEVNGKLYTFEDRPDVDQADLAIDLNPLIDNFRRAYGFGLHPNFETNRQLFVAYAGDPVGRPDGSRLSRFTVSKEPPYQVDPESEVILLTWPSGGHNGCAIRFDSKGLLYFSAGDGARPFPPDEYDVSQDLSDLRSSICRIDVDHASGGKAYSIPPDNPFVNVPNARGEIWAYGFRNPWRFTVVPDTDQILCGDVGWELWELVFDVKRGGNYGWSLFEGPQPIRRDLEPGPTPIQKPLVAYPHAVGQSVTGGVVYRGDEHEDLQGVYLYGDYVTGLLWGLRHEGTQVSWNPVLAETGLAIITFAESRNREVLVVGYDGGIHKLIKNASAGKSEAFPRKLSQTGLFDDIVEFVPSPGVIEYHPIAAADSQGTGARFHLGVPALETIRIQRQQRRWVYPAGTVFAKTITKGKLSLETQLLYFDGINWHPYSYLWNAEQTDADLVDRDGADAVFEFANSSGVSESMVWRVANRAQCRACHSVQNGGAVGFSLENLGREQVEQFVNWRILDRDAPKAWNIQTMVDPRDETASLENRARSFLAANCAHCHRRGGGGTVPTDLAYLSSADEMNAINVRPSQGDFGIKHARVVSPGQPERSVLFYRMMTGGSGHMPKLGSRDNAVEGLKLIHDWIEAMNTDIQDRVHVDQPREEVSDADFDTAIALREASQLLFEGDANEEQRRETARKYASSAAMQSAALFERFLPEPERRKVLGDRVDVELVLAANGNSSRGRERFLNNQSMQCSQCHRVQGSGQSVGPDLDLIGGKRSRRELLDSILLPSKVIDPKYQTHQLLTVDGQVLVGLQVHETDDRVVLRTADGKHHNVDREEIESRRVQSESLMPSGLAAEMTLQELADLLAFLESLK